MDEGKIESIDKTLTQNRLNNLNMGHQLSTKTAAEKSHSVFPHMLLWKLSKKILNFHGITSIQTSNNAQSFINFTGFFQNSNELNLALNIQIVYMPVCIFHMPEMI